MNELVVDIASTAKPFDETFFNQLARDGLDEPDEGLCAVPLVVPS